MLTTSACFDMLLFKAAGRYAALYSIMAAKRCKLVMQGSVPPVQAGHTHLGLLGQDSADFLRDRRAQDGQVRLHPKVSLLHICTNLTALQGPSSAASAYDDC